jgi:hypothetical protein
VEAEALAKIDLEAMVLCLELVLMLQMAVAVVDPL